MTGIKRHKIPLVFFEIPLHGGAESQLEPAASVNLHRFRPHLLDIGSGSSFVLQNVNLGLLRVHHDGDKAAVAGTVKGQEVKGRQKGWERENPATDSGNPSEKTMDGFVEVTEQMELPC